MSRHLVFAAFIGSLAASAPVRSAPALAAGSACAPGVSFWSLLGNVGVGYADGRLRIDKLYAVCLPQPATSSDSNYGYSPGRGGKLSSVIKSADGQVLGTYVWAAESIGGLWELSDCKVLGGAESLKPLAAGNYTLEFRIEDAAPFYAFAFAIATLPSDDPYEAAGTRWFIDGAWNEYGNVFYQRNDPQSSLRFTTWVRDKAGHAQPRSAPYVAQLVRLQDGKVIGEETGTLKLDPHWGQLDVYFAARGNASERIKAADVLAQDGAYRVVVSIDGKPFGDYAFAVSGGAIAVRGAQAEKTPPQQRIVDYLYGGKYRSWWIRREGAAQIAR